MNTNKHIEIYTGHCYCGKTSVSTTSKPQTIAYCHCVDCRRWTSAPVAAFAAFKEEDVTFTPNEGKVVEVNSGATRTFCDSCGTPLTGRYEYLPGQIYIGVSIFDQDDSLIPQIHCHESDKLNWLHIEDDLEKIPASARTQLASKSRTI